MVRSLILRFVSSTALVCLAPVGLAGTASAQTTDLHFKTAITEVYDSPYPITGRLDVQIFPNGILRGYYHTSYYKLFIPVVGGRDGNYVWFDIGPSSVDLGLGTGPEGRLHVVGVMNGDGSFRGQVYPQTAAFFAGTSPLTGVANQENNVVNLTPSTSDQYLFSATPTNEPMPTVSGPP